MKEFRCKSDVLCGCECQADMRTMASSNVTKMKQSTKVSSSAHRGGTNCGGLGHGDQGFTVHEKDASFFYGRIDKTKSGPRDSREGDPLHLVPCGRSPGWPTRRESQLKLEPRELQRGSRGASGGTGGAARRGGESRPQERTEGADRQILPAPLRTRFDGGTLGR